MLLKNMAGFDLFTLEKMFSPEKLKEISDEYFRFSSRVKICSESLSYTNFLRQKLMEENKKGNIDLAAIEPR